MDSNNSWKISKIWIILFQKLNLADILSYSLDHIKNKKLLLMIKWNIFSTWYMEIIETKYLFLPHTSVWKNSLETRIVYFFSLIYKITDKYVYYYIITLPLILADYCLDSYYRDLIRRLYLYFPTNCLLEHLNSFLQNCCLH